MRSLAHLLLFVAALAYGAMPMTGMAAVPMTQVATMADDLHHPASTVMAEVDCPHSGGASAIADAEDGAGGSFKPMKTSGHCAACLTLAAQPAFSSGGTPARAAEAGTLSARLVSQTPAPLTPPPRA